MPTTWNKNLKRGPPMSPNNSSNKPNNSAVEEGEIASPHRNHSNSVPHSQPNNYHHKGHQASSYNSNGHHNSRRSGSHYTAQYNNRQTQRHTQLSRHSTHPNSTSSLRSGSISGNTPIGGNGKSTSVSSIHEEGEISNNSTFSNNANTTGVTSSSSSSFKFHHRFHGPPLNNRRGSLSDKNHRDSSRDPRDVRDIRKDPGYSSYYHRQSSSSSQSSVQQPLQSSSSSGLPIGSYAELIPTSEKVSHSNGIFSSSKIGISSLKNDGKGASVTKSAPNWEPPSRHASSGSINKSGGALSSGRANSVGSSHSSTSSRGNIDRRPGGNSSVNHSSNVAAGPFSAAPPPGERRRSISTGYREINDNTNRNLTSGSGKDSGYGSSLSDSKGEETNNYYGPASSGWKKKAGSSGINRDLSAYGAKSRERENNKGDGGVERTVSLTHPKQRFKPPPSRPGERLSSSPSNTYFRSTEIKGFSPPPSKPFFQSRETLMEMTKNDSKPNFVSRPRVDPREKQQFIKKDTSSSSTYTITTKISHENHQSNEYEASSSPSKSNSSIPLTCESLGNKSDMDKAVELIGILSKMNSDEFKDTSTPSSTILPSNEQIMNQISDLDSQINKKRCDLDIIEDEIKDALQDEKDRKRLEQERFKRERELEEVIEKEKSDWKKERETDACEEAHMTDRIDKLRRVKTSENNNNLERESQQLTMLQRQILDQKQSLQVKAKQSIQGELRRFDVTSKITIENSQHDAHEANKQVEMLTLDSETATTAIEQEKQRLREVTQASVEQSSKSDDCIPLHVSQKVRTLIDFTKDTSSEIENVISSILTENQKRARKAHEESSSSILHDCDDPLPPDLVPDLTSQSNSRVREVNGFGNALYSEPSETPFYESINRNHSAIHCYVKERMRQKNRTLKRRWIELAEEYTVRQKRYTNQLSKEAAGTLPGNNWNSIHTEPAPPESDMMATMTIPNRRSRRSGGASSFFTSDVVRSEYDQQQIIAQLEEKEKKEKTIKEGGSQLPRQQCDLERELNVGYKDNFSSRHVKDPLRSEADQHHINPWSDREKCIFFDAFLIHPKDFRRIASYLRNKSTRECVAFYYDSKKVVPYKAALKEHTMRKKKRCNTISWDSTIQAALAMGAAVTAGSSDDKPVIFSLPVHDDSYFTKDFHPMRFEMFENCDITTTQDSEKDYNQSDGCSEMKFFLNDSVRKLLHTNEERIAPNSDTDDNKSRVSASKPSSYGEKKRSKIETSGRKSTPKSIEVEKTNEEPEKFTHEGEKEPLENNGMNGIETKDGNEIGFEQENFNSMNGTLQGNISYFDNELGSRLYASQSDQWIHSNRSSYNPVDQHHHTLNETRQNHFEMNRQHDNLRRHHDQMKMNQHWLEQRRQQQHLDRQRLEQFQHQQVHHLLTGNHDLNHPQNSQQIMSWLMHQQQQSSRAPHTNGYSMQLGRMHGVNLEQNDILHQSTNLSSNDNQGRLAMNIGRDDLNLLARIADATRSNHHQDPRNL